VPKPQFLKDVSDWWRYLGAKQLAGYVFAMVGIGLTIWAVNVDKENQLLIAVLAAFAQLIAASLFAGKGKADPTHAKRLITLGLRVGTAETAASDSFEKATTTTQRRDDMGQLSAELGWIGEGIRNAVFDWTAFNEHLKELLSDDEREAAARYAAALGRSGGIAVERTAPSEMGSSSNAQQ
jgi:hypothetical protein